MNGSNYRKLQCNLQCSKNSRLRLKFLNVIIHSCSFFKRTSLSLKALRGQFSGVALRQVSGNTFLCTFSSFLTAVSS